MEGSKAKCTGRGLAIVPYWLDNGVWIVVRGEAMGPIALPWFIRPDDIDELIFAGESAQLSVQCRDCGACGDFDRWVSGKPGDDKLCPCCGHYAGVKIE